MITINPQAADVITIQLSDADQIQLNTTAILLEDRDVDTLDGENGAYYLDRDNHTGTQAVNTITGLATVATSGSYNDLSNKPTISTDAETLDGQDGAYYLSRANHTGTQAISTISGLQAALDDKLESVAWGDITGTLSDQTDLQDALNFDLSMYAKKSDAFIDLGVLVADVNLDTLTTAGRWALSSGTGIATTALNYPANGVSGVLEIIKNAASVVVVQRFTAAGSTTPIEYYRIYRTSWSTWQSDKHAIPTGLLESGNLGSSNLDTFTSTGFYVQGTSGNATLALNYPETTSGFLEVIKTITSGLITQRYTTSTNKIYLRNGTVSSFGAWVLISTAGSVNTPKIVGVMSNSINANTLTTEFATYIVNSIILDLALTNLPVQSFGILTVYKGSMTSFAMQSFLTNAGVTYARHWNGSVWSAWSIPASGGGGAVDDTITFSKTKYVLSWNLANSGVGTNKIKHAYSRGISVPTNRDSWGMGKAVLVTEAGATVNDLTTTGVWECAIIDSENVGDHSGGGHGDEVKNLSYFLVDGIYRAEDFVETFKAKEVKHIQHSTIYVEGQMTPICRRETVWTFNKNGCTSKTKLIFDTVRTINKARVAMLPIYRKANTDGTGVQITDTEIRSQDDLVIDVTVHGFALRDLPITDGDSILLSSDVSKISGTTTVKAIDAPDPHAYVQNTILYNKVYINAFAETAPAYVTTAGEVWQIETNFVLKVRS